MMLLTTLAILSGGEQTGEALTRRLAPSQDNTLYEHPRGALSNGAGEHFFVGTTDRGAIRRGVLAFDIAGRIPAGSIITRVTLTLRLSRTTAASQAITLHRLLADWGEGASNAAGDEGGGAPATRDDATWIHTFFPTAHWAEAGGDFAATVSARQLVAEVGRYTWGSTLQMVADVQAWLDMPTTNFGWILLGNETTSHTAKRFDTRENTAANRPVLTVEFMPGCNGRVATIVGTEEDDSLVGTNGDDVIAGLGGNDVIHGLAGQDVLCGGSGDDVLFGDAGADRVFGDAGNDILHGGIGADSLFGGLGHDVLLGEAGADILVGGSGNDSLQGGSDDDRLFGSSGHDTLSGDPGADRLNGGTGVDVCDGTRDTDTDAASGCEENVNIP
jgi:Ca2+-binding RTX toxin-like protein